MEGENKFNQGDNADEKDGGFAFDGGNNQEIVTPRSSKEKVVSTAVAVTIFIAVIAIFASIKNINRPAWELFPAPASNVKDELAGVLDLQSQDTDGDGLSDYDETYVYSTSPYLADTDSDGFSDKDEIEKGYDPNCAGQSCVSGDTNTSVGPVVAGNSIGNQILSGEATPAMIRSLLLERGVKQADLDKISDTDLVSLYQETLANGPVDNAVVNTNSVTTDPSIQSEAQLRALTGAQIRALMITQGAPESMLNQLTDEQLKTMFINQLDSQTSSQ